MSKPTIENNQSPTRKCLECAAESGHKAWCSLAAMPGSDNNVIVAEGYYRMKQRVEELEAAIVNVYRWTGSKRCARECKRILPDVAQRCHQNE